jgi:hypothetical protein
LGGKNRLNYNDDTRNLLQPQEILLPVMPLLIQPEAFVQAFFIRLENGFIRYWAKAILDGVRGFRQTYGERKRLKKETLDVIRAIKRQNPGVI